MAMGYITASRQTATLQTLGSHKPLDTVYDYNEDETDN